MGAVECKVITKEIRVTALAPSLAMWQFGAINLFCFNLLQIIKVLAFCFLFSTPSFSSLRAEELQVFHTKIYSITSFARIAVVPDGSEVILEIAPLTNGLKVMNISTKEISPIPVEEGRVYLFASWSPDGKRLVVISSKRQGDLHNIDDMQICVLESGTWKSTTLTKGVGYRITPFFSVDGKTIYYFKGKRRNKGMTPASHYDLYAIDLGGGEERRLTYEEIYQMDSGDDDGQKVLFQAYGANRFSSKYFSKQFNRDIDQAGLYLYVKENAAIVPLQIDQSNGVFNFYHPRRDRMGNIYFITNTLSSGGGGYARWLGRVSSSEKRVELLKELSVASSFDIARNVGVVFSIENKKGEWMVLKSIHSTAK